MTTDDRAAYSKAFSDAERRAKREGLIIHHCRWKDGLLDVLTMPKGEVQSAEPPEFLLPERERRIRRAERGVQGSLL